MCCVAGGRGKDGAPIITFPEYSGFSEVPEEDFLNVVTYLTSIPRYISSSYIKQNELQGERKSVSNYWFNFFSVSSLDAASIGFIIIIDRRKDKWSSVKASLSRIAVSS